VSASEGWRRALPEVDKVGFQSRSIRQAPSPESNRESRILRNGELKRIAIARVDDRDE
jgi:hypothetical protein